jgi:hypothetical protein
MYHLNFYYLDLFQLLEFVQVHQPHAIHIPQYAYNYVKNTDKIY